MVSYFFDRFVLIATSVLFTWIVLEDRKALKETMELAKNLITTLQNNQTVYVKENNVRVEEGQRNTYV